MQIGNAPCSWGVLEFGLEGKTDHYQKVLDEMSSAGYTGTELGDWGFLPTDPATLQKELSDRNLDLVGAFVPVNFIDGRDHQKGAEIAIKTARLLDKVNERNARIVLSDDNGKNNTRTKFAGRIQKEHGLSPSEWKTFANGVEQVAQKVLDETGVKCVFHHHCAGYIETPEEIEKLLNLTNPSLVGLCLDTGHFAFGGGDPVQGLKKFSNRLEHVHFKDWDRSIFDATKKNDWDYFESVGNGIFCELGHGSIDFPAIVDELNRQHYSGWIIVEQDILPGMGTPKESALRNREYLKSIGI